MEMEQQKEAVAATVATSLHRCLFTTKSFRRRRRRRTSMATTTLCHVVLLLLVCMGSSPLAGTGVAGMEDNLASFDSNFGECDLNITLFFSSSLAFNEEKSKEIRDKEELFCNFLNFYQR